MNIGVVFVVLREAGVESILWTLVDSTRNNVNSKCVQIVPPPGRNPALDEVDNVLQRVEVCNMNCYQIRRCIHR
jgi:hypothetical protein